MKTGIVLLSFCAFYFVGQAFIEVFVNAELYGASARNLTDGIIGWYAIGFGIWGLVTIVRSVMRRLRSARPTRQS